LRAFEADSCSAPQFWGHMPNDRYGCMSTDKNDQLWFSAPGEIGTDV
jgi:hypothetical protein